MYPQSIDSETGGTIQYQTDIRYPTEDRRNRMSPEWKDRVAHWLRVLEEEFYEPLGEIALEGFETMDMLSPEEAERGSFSPMAAGTAWGPRWGYLWLRGEIVLEERAQGQMIVMDLRQGGEATVFVDGEAFGTRRAEWVSTPHHYICDQVLTKEAKPGTRYHLLLEAYAGHGYPGEENDGCATGPVRPAESGFAGDYAPMPDSALRQRMGMSTYGIWHEEAYQLWLDVRTLADLLEGKDLQEAVSVN